MNPPFNTAPAQEAVARSCAGVSRMPGRPIRSASGSRTAARLLRPAGVLTLIWRADGLDSMLGGARRRFRRGHAASGASAAGGGGDPGAGRAPSRQAARRSRCCRALCSRMPPASRVRKPRPSCVRARCCPWPGSEFSFACLICPLAAAARLRYGNRKKGATMQRRSRCIRDARLQLNRLGSRGRRIRRHGCCLLREPLAWNVGKADDDTDQHQQHVDLHRPRVPVPSPALYVNV